MATESAEISETGYDDLFSRQVAEEQIQEVYRQIPFAIVGPMFGAAITALLLFDYVDAVNIYTWCALVFVSYPSLLLLRVWYLRSGSKTTHAGSWGRRYLFMSWLVALCWGSASIFLFSPDDFTAQMILTMSVMVGAAAITVFTVIYQPVFYTTIALIAPLITQFVRAGDGVHYIMAMGCVGYMMMLFFMNVSVNKLVEQSIRLRFSNYKLASDLRSQKEIAEKSSMAKSSFLAVASHDLRQPLHAHGLFLGELRERLPGETVLGKIFNKLDASLLVISELFDSLLDISRLEAGAVDANIQSFYFDDFIDPIVEQYRAKAKASGLDFHVFLPHRIIKSDRVLLGRIVRNLLENAVCYTPEGKILIGGRWQDDSLTIQVWDTGYGIAEAELDNIFGDYYQVKQHVARKVCGLGLGLSVVSQLCSLLGHSISVKSVTGKGSVFSVEVPVSESASVLIREVDPGTLVMHGLDGMKVLVIDDDKSVRLGMSGILDSWKCNVITGSDAEDTLGKLPHGYVPDIILADYQLNDGKTGLQEIKLLNAHFNRDIEAAVITGDLTVVSRNEPEVCRYPLLQKPVSPAKLSTLLRYVRSKRQEASA